MALSLSRADSTVTLHATSRHGLLPHAHRETPTPFGPPADPSRRPAAARGTALDVAVRDLLADGRLVVRPLEQVRAGYDIVVNCTGFGARCTDEPLIAELVRRDLARPHPLGTGLVVDAHGRPVTPSGVIPNVTVLGALRRGVLCETTAVPELRQQAAEAAALLTSTVAA
ncbi:MAG TPA: hypothetical protein VLR26_15880 [Frankiaceae bacterium]|nr:hypothetical protein [Frankiaceae bacterium]